MIRTHAVGIVFAVVLTGCQSDPAPAEVTGTITLDGQPLAEGTVQFVPTDARLGQARYVVVKDGAFQLPPTEGLRRGAEFRVIVQGFRKTGRKFPAADPSQPMQDETEQFLPARYNTESTLKIVAPPVGSTPPITLTLRTDPGGEKIQ